VSASVSHSRGVPDSAVFLAGPTAVGKTEIALRLAEGLGAEIISVDSMQVYRGMDIGTAKPSPAERQRVPHHLIDVVDPSEAFDAAQFVRLAWTAKEEILARGRVPLYSGGTGLYFKALLEGLSDSPAGDAELRAELERTPLEVLLEELAAGDPQTLARIDQRNPRRVIRAVEVLRLTGRPLSAQQAKWADAATGSQPMTRFFVLDREPADRRARIEARVDQMFAAGLVAETERLLTQGLGRNPTAMQAIGYRQVVEYLRGERSLAETIELVKARTRQYARRQLTWFRRQVAARWVPIQPGESAEGVVARLRGFLS